MKKVLLALVIAGMFAGSAFGAGLKTGMLSLTNMSSEEFAKFTESHFVNEGGWRLLDKNHGSEDIFVAFDDLASMMMALHSDKVDDVVFWYHIWQDVEKQPDVVDGILLSEPYYGWDTALHLRNFRR